MVHLEQKETRQEHKYKHDDKELEETRYWRKVDEILEQLNTFYNCNVLNSESDDIRETVYNEVISRINNPVLQRLLNNYNENQKFQLEVLQGLDVLWVMENKKTHQTFYIAGETHRTDLPYCGSSSVSFYNYIRELLWMTDVFVDIFIEIDILGWKAKKQALAECNVFKNYNYGSGNSKTLTEFRNLKKCLNPYERGKHKECELARIHYVDARFDMAVEDSLHSIAEPDLPLEASLLYLWQTLRSWTKIDLKRKCLYYNIRMIAMLNPENIGTLKKFVDVWYDKGLGEAVLSHSRLINKHWDKLDDPSKIKSVLRDYLDEPLNIDDETLGNPTPALILKEFLGGLTTWQETKLEPWLKFNNIKIEQLIRFSEEEIPNDIWDLCLEASKLIYDYIVSCFQKVKEYTKIDGPITRDEIRAYMSEWGTMELSMVRTLDVYAAKRMLQKFNVTTSNQPDKAYQAIFFGGYSHSCGMHRIFTKLDFETMWSAWSLDINRLEQSRVQTNFYKDCMANATNQLESDGKGIGCLTMNGEASTPWFGNPPPGLP